ncbi:MAG: GIY-YIG nuclease family protein [Luminiphilus sp.]|jgi:putative endonuclease|nr:GIY-YIG nuclease family protein [Luminiphilus sp.]
MHDAEPNWHVYIVRCADESLYTGVTTDLRRRISQHNGIASGGARYTRSRRPVALVWSRTCASRSAAQKEETAVRRLSRRQKLALIRQHGMSAPL